MDTSEDLRQILEALEGNLKNLNALISNKKTEYLDWKKKSDDEKNIYDRIIFEKEQLEKILNECSVHVCKYKNEFEAIRNKYSDEMQLKVVNDKSHFLLCYRKEYSGKGKDVVIQKHTEIIEKNGFCWWGKFANERQKGGKYTPLEPFGESIKSDHSAGVALRIKEKVDERVANRDPVYLYIYNPNPPDTGLYVGNIADFYYGEGKHPYQDKKERIPPECAYIPEYYFHRHDGNCVSCKEVDLKKCQLRFQCNFWFRLDRIKQLKDAEEEFVNLKNCFTEDSINLAIPILYPLLVTQRTNKSYFPEMVEPLTCEAGFTLNISRREKSHTKVSKVQRFFSDLNKACGECFAAVELIGCQPVFSNEARLQQSEEMHEIYLVLPSEFRGDRKGSKFKISLDKKTTAEQKEKAQQLIEGILGGLKSVPPT